MATSRVHARNAAARRLRRLTAALVAVAGLAALLFAVVAAKAFPGRSSHQAPARKSVRVVHAPARQPRQAAPPLVSVGSNAQPQAPAPTPTPAAPAPTAAPPVVVSGGS